MKTAGKVTLGIIGALVVIFIALGGLGYFMPVQAEKHLVSMGFTEVKAVQQSDDIMCAGAKTGIIVSVKPKSDAAFDYIPVCVDIFGDAEVGELK